MLQGFEPVAICDQFRFLLIGKLKTKCFGKALDITFYLLIKTFVFNPIDCSKIPIDHHLNTPDSKNQVLYLICLDDSIVLYHAMSFLVH